MSDMQRIDFHGHQISTCKDESTGKVYCIPREICEQLGVLWTGQHAKLTQSKLYKPSMLRIDISTEAGQRETWMLDVDMLPSWLTSIAIGRVKPEIQATLLVYQRESATALRNYWFTGAAINPRTSLPQVRNPANQMLIDTIVRLDEVEQRALCAEEAAHAANLRATRAETKADMALDDAHRMTVEEFILVNGLIRQFPHTKHGEYARWLGDFCLQCNLKTPKAPVLGKSWDKEKSYPLQALAAWLRYEQRRPQQITLVRPPDEGRNNA